MTKIRVKIKEESKGELQPSLEKKLVVSSNNAVKALDKKYEDRLKSNNEKQSSRNK